MSSLNKGITKVEFKLKWDPSPAGRPVSDLDIVAAVFPKDAPQGPPGYLVYFDSRSPDGTINLNHDSLDGQGFGWDEVMTLELERLSSSYGRVVIGVIIQQGGGRWTFGDVAGKGVLVQQGYAELMADGLDSVAGSTAATVGEFVRDASGEWEFRPMLRGFDGDPDVFARTMGRRNG